MRMKQRLFKPVYFVALFLLTLVTGAFLGDVVHSYAIVRGLLAGGVYSHRANNYSQCSRSYAGYHALVHRVRGCVGVAVSPKKVDGVLPERNRERSDRCHFANYIACACSNRQSDKSLDGRNNASRLDFNARAVAFFSQLENINLTGGVRLSGSIDRLYSEFATLRP